MIDYRKDNYRLTNICNLNTGTRPDNEGLAVEKKCPNSDSYYVICFVKPDEEGAYIDDVGLRILDIEDDEWPLVKRLIDIARGIIEE